LKLCPAQEFPVVLKFPFFLPRADLLLDKKLSSATPVIFIPDITLLSPRLAIGSKFGAAPFFPSSQLKEGLFSSATVSSSIATQPVTTWIPFSCGFTPVDEEFP